MRVPISEDAWIELGAPTLPAFERADRQGRRQWVAWCPHCRRWHTHRPGEGHRNPHCTRRHSPSYAMGYNLAYAGRFMGRGFRLLLRVMAIQVGGAAGALAALGLGQFLGGVTWASGTGFVLQLLIQAGLVGLGGLTGWAAIKRALSGRADWRRGHEYEPEQEAAPEVSTAAGHASGATGHQRLRDALPPPL